MEKAKQVFTRIFYIFSGICVAAIVVLFLIDSFVVDLDGNVKGHVTLKRTRAKADVVSIFPGDKHQCDSFEEYLEGVKYVLDNMKEITEIQFDGSMSMTAFSKEEWDQMFQLLSDNQYTFNSITIDRVDDLNTITGIGALSDIPDFQSLHIGRSNYISDATELSDDFPDMPNIINLYVYELSTDLVKHFPNLEEIDCLSSLGLHTSTVEAILDNCKSIKKITGNDVRTHPDYRVWYAKKLREEFVRYAIAPGKGKIDGKFTVLIDEGEEAKFRYLSSGWTDYDNGDGVMYVDDCRECDFYVLVFTKNIQRYGKYTSGTIGYTRDYYIQIHDIKNKTKYSQVFIATSYPQSSIFYNGNAPEVEYGSLPSDEIRAYIEAAIVNNN
jgi:hypothetical protein